MIITVLNGEKWIDSCMKSIVKQTILADYKGYAEEEGEDGVVLSKYHSLQEAQTPFMSNTLTSTTLSTLTVATTTTTSPSQATTSTPNETELHTRSTRNASPHLLIQQIEICVFDDCSCDNTYNLLRSWQDILKRQFNISMYILQNNTGKPKGGILGGFLIANISVIIF